MARFGRSSSAPVSVVASARGLPENGLRFMVEPPEPSFAFVVLGGIVLLYIAYIVWKARMAKKRVAAAVAMEKQIEAGKDVEPPECHA